MKFRSLYRFSNLQDNQNLIFFAQLLEEMLFDYTLDTYKPSILNVHSLIDEAFNVIHEVDKGNIMNPNIGHVLDELASCLDKDIIANNMLSISKKEINSILKNPKERENHAVVKNTLGIIYSGLEKNKYKENLEVKILEIINSKNVNYKEIRTISRSYITFLISNGYNSNYIRKEVIEFFWGDNKEKFESFSEINVLFEKFSFNKIDYQVFFVADSIMSMCILPSDKEFSLLREYEDCNLPSKIKEISNFIKKIGKEEKFYSLNINDVDPFSARERAERSVSELSNLINIFHHKKNISWRKQFILIDDKENTYIVNEKVKSMHKCIDLKEPKARIKLQHFLTSFRLQEDSFNKFINSVRLHSIAIHTNSHENQLLNLWVSLESLVPADTKNSDGCTIQHIIDSIIPFLNMSYLNSLLDKLVKDLIRWNDKKTKKILKNVNGGDLIIKLARLLSRDEYQECYDELIEESKEFYLLNDRLNYFKNILSSKEEVCNIMSNHTERLQWQIRRIYRARNLIVHTGNTPDYTPILIEHIHSYLDIILSNLIKLSSERKVTSVGQGFQYMKLLYSNYTSLIGMKNKKLENVKLTDEDLIKIFKY